MTKPDFKRSRSLFRDCERLAATEFNVKALGDAGAFEGYAAIFDIVDEGGDAVLPGAFARSLAERGEAGIKLLWQHEPSEPIGRIEQILEDQKGLFVRGQLLLDIERAREAYALMKSGALDGLSIGFRTVKSRRDEERNIRLLEDIDLWEVSLVTFPMQAGARISSFKSGAIGTVREFEAFLRDAGGFSRTEAKAIAAKGFARTRDQREAGATWASVLDSVKRVEALIQIHS